MQETIDHISSRVGAAGLTGAVAGSFTGLYKGHHSVFRTAALTSFSCALAATACFGTERIIYVAAKSYLLDSTKDASDPSFHQKLSIGSHAGGGLIGGAWIGTLYFERTLRGALLFTPLMIAIALAEEQIKQRFQDSHREAVDTAAAESHDDNST